MLKKKKKKVRLCFVPFEDLYTAGTFTGAGVADLLYQLHQKNRIHVLKNGFGFSEHKKRKRHHI